MNQDQIKNAIRAANNAANELGFVEEFLDRMKEEQGETPDLFEQNQRLLKELAEANRLKDNAVRSLKNVINEKSELGAQMKSVIDDFDQAKSDLHNALTANAKLMGTRDEDGARIHGLTLLAEERFHHIKSLETQIKEQELAYNACFADFCNLRKEYNALNDKLEEAQVLAAERFGELGALRHQYNELKAKPGIELPDHFLAGSTVYCINRYKGTVQKTKALTVKISMSQGSTWVEYSLEGVDGLTGHSEVFESAGDAFRALEAK